MSMTFFFSFESREIATEKIKIIVHILSQGSFQIKHWIISGSKENYNLKRLLLIYFIPSTGGESCGNDLDTKIGCICVQN